LGAVGGTVRAGLLALEFTGCACKDTSEFGNPGARVRDELTVLLRSLEAELRVQGRWDDTPPPPEALHSSQPFACDTLSLDQWLQWILLPGLDALLAQQLPLPTACAVRPMAEEVYRQQDDPQTERIIDIVDAIDRLLTTSADARH